MPRTVEAIIDEHGWVRLLEPVTLSEPRRALVTVLTEPPLETAPASAPADTALLSEEALAKDWNRPEEDAAWQHLQPAP